MKKYILIFLSVLLAIPVFGQDEEPIRVDTDLVNINVAIRDRDGKYVTGLKKENFEVFDNGTRQEIEYFSADEAGISFGVVYDLHPTTDERTVAVLESLRELAKSLGERDDIFSVVFNRRGSLVTDFIPTSEQVTRHLAGVYREPNALYDAIFLATEKIRERPNAKKVLLVITDSADHHSEHRFNDVLKQAKTLDVQIYTVLWDETGRWEYADITRDGELQRRVSVDATNLDRAALEELAMRTGGTVQSPTVENAAELFRIYTGIAFEMRRAYTLGFYPEQRDGRRHDLRIGLKSVKNSGKMVLSYRTVYQSPPEN